MQSKVPKMGKNFCVISRKTAINNINEELNIEEDSNMNGSNKINDVNQSMSIIYPERNLFLILGH